MFHQVWTSQLCGQWICKDYECQAFFLLSHQSGRLATTPIIECKIYRNIIEATVDTGATYTCLKPSEVRLVKSNTLIRTVGLSGKKSMSQPIDIEIEEKIVRTQVLMAEHAPNLIGRDVLCALDAKITMTPRGLALQCPVKGEKTETQTVRSVAYWVTAEEIMKKANKK